MIMSVSANPLSIRADLVEALKFDLVGPDNAHEFAHELRPERRYRWPDEIRDEVLARLLKLNAERAEEEKLAGRADAKSTKPRKPRKKPGTGAQATGDLFDPNLGIICGWSSDSAAVLYFNLGCRI
jgi:hypothetical protein